MSAPPLSSRLPYRTAPRQGTAASNRNFGQSSAGGGRPAASLVGAGGVANPPPPRFAKGRAAGALEAAGLGPAQVNKAAHWGQSYVMSEDSIRNDYSTHYVKSGERPQNHLRGADVAQRFSEYPKLASLLQLKHGQLASPLHSIPPTYRESEVVPATLADLAPSRFDVILISPPSSVTFEELRAFDLSKAAATPGFVWLWVGSGQKGDGVGLEKGRELLTAWGYRRCEDIVWLKTNKTAPANDLISESPGVFTPTVEHCLMGIRGTVRRSNDPWFVHCNVDTDVIVWEGDPADKQLKPPELQSLIENFCLGTRRLHLYGSPHSLRRGWVTVGPSFAPLAPASAPSNLPLVRPVEGESTAWGPVQYDRDLFEARFAKTGQGQSLEDQMRDADLGGVHPPGAPEKVSTLLPYLEELDALRPKSPPPRNGQPSSGGLGRGRGAGLGVTRSAVLPNGPSSLRGSRGPPPNRGPAPPPPNGYYSSYPPSQHHHYHPPPPQHFQQPPPFYPMPYNSAFTPQQHNPYAFNPQAPPFAPPFAAPINPQLVYQQQQAVLFQQWLAMGGAHGMGYPPPPGSSDQVGGSPNGSQGQWQGNDGMGQQQFNQHYSPNPP